MSHFFQINGLPVVTLQRAISLDDSSGRVYIYYDLEELDGETVSIKNFQYNYLDKWFNTNALTGITVGLVTTQNLLIIWNSSVDLPNIDATIRFRFLANDGFEDGSYDEIEFSISNTGPDIKNDYVTDPQRNAFTLNTTVVRVGAFFLESIEGYDESAGIKSILFEYSINDSTLTDVHIFEDTTNYIFTDYTEVFHDFDLREDGEEIASLSDAIYYRITATDQFNNQTVVVGQSTAAALTFVGYRKLFIYERNMTDNFGESIYDTDTMVRYDTLKQI